MNLLLQNVNLYDILFNELFAKEGGFTVKVRSSVKPICENAKSSKEREASE